MIEYKRQTDTNLIEIRVSNTNSDTDLNWLAAQIKQDTQRHRQLCVLEEIHSLEGINPLTFWKDTRFGFSYNKRVRRAAIVVDTQWVSFFQRVAASLISVEVGVYSHSQIESARQWLKEKVMPLCVHTDCHALVAVNVRTNVGTTFLPTSLAA